MRPRAAQRHVRGFSLPSAVFILVVLTAGGALAVRMANSGQTALGFSLQGARAEQAARAGLEWGIHRALATSTCPPATSLALTEAGLAGLTVDVSCSVSVHEEGSQSRNVFVLVAVGEAGSFGDRDYARRRIQATVTDAS